jgi:hypothetical protein
MRRTNDVTKPVSPGIVVTIVMDGKITLEKYNAFMNIIKTFMQGYKSLIDSVGYETVAPTIYTIPVVVNACGDSLEQVREDISTRLQGSPYDVTFPDPNASIILDPKPSVEPGRP